MRKEEIKDGSTCRLMVYFSCPLHSSQASANTRKPLAPWTPKSISQPTVSINKLNLLLLTNQALYKFICHYHWIHSSRNTNSYSKPPQRLRTVYTIKREGNEKIDTNKEHLRSPHERRSRGTRCHWRRKEPMWRNWRICLYPNQLHTNHQLPLLNNLFTALL